MVFEWDIVPGKHEGMRGLTAVPAEPGGTAEVLLGTLEGQGYVMRIDPANNHAASVEFDYKGFFTNLWGSLGGAATLAAYNDMTSVVDPRDGKPLQLIGLWVNHPSNDVPPHNGSYYLIRHPDGRYEWARVFDHNNPVPSGDNLRATRCMAVSPFPEDGGRVVYFGGYDAGGAPMKHNTAWIYRGEMPAIELPATPCSDAVGIELLGSNIWLLTLGTTATNCYQLEECADPVQPEWEPVLHRITGTGWPYPTVWTNAPGRNLGVCALQQDGALIPAVWRLNPKKSS